MNSILQGLQHVICYFDDILVTGTTEEEHLQNLDTQVLRRLKENGMWLKKDKCHIWQSSVNYLGHYVDAQGIQAAPAKFDAIQRAPAPCNVRELCSF